MSIIFETIHGSRLYGTHNATSDWDSYAVYANDHEFERGERGQRITIEYGVTADRMKVTLDEFLNRVARGSHQSVEALFSKRKIWGDDDSLRHFFGGMRLSSPDIYATYERTIRKFAFGDYKRRRHAARLALNLTDLRREGRFDPTLTADQRVHVDIMAAMYEGDELLARLGA